MSIPRFKRSCQPSNPLPLAIIWEVSSRCVGAGMRELQIEYIGVQAHEDSVLLGKLGYVRRRS